MKNKNVYVISLTLIFCVFSLLSCKKEEEKKNLPPVLSEIVHVPVEAEVGETCQFMVTAYDPEGEALTYNWFTTDGSIISSTSTNTISWVAPSTTGQCVITVEVNDKVNTVTDDDTINVVTYPVLSVSKTSLDFGTATGSLTFAISNTGTGEINWSVTEDLTWVTITSAASGTVTTEEDIVEVTVSREELAASIYNGSLSVETNAGNVTISLSMTVEATQTADFFDDFSADVGNWTYSTYCTHSIANGELAMSSTASDYSYYADHAFSSTLDIPWTFEADVNAVSGTVSDQWTGILVELDDAGMYAIWWLWLAVIDNPDHFSGNNWIWLWYIPDIEYAWMPWDENCYGYSASVNSMGSWNTLEMIANANETFTLKCNGTALSSNNNSINEFESMTSIDVSLGVDILSLMGDANSSTKWDNVSFDSETTDLKMGSSTPKPPTEKELAVMMNKMKNGEIRTIKEILLEKNKK